jgi:hypothetical protein
VEHDARAHRPSLHEAGDSRGDAATYVCIVGPHYAGAREDLTGAARTVTADHGYN